MAHGIRITGESGNVQIDENYSNHHFIGKATIATTTAVSNNGCSYVDVTFTGCISTVLAIRCDRPATYTLISVSGGTWTFRFVVGWTGTYVDTRGTQLTYYRFDANPPPSNDVWGFRVRDGAGKITFDSGYRPLKVVDFLNDLASDFETFTYQAGRTYGAIPARGGGRSEIAGVQGTVTYAYFFKAARNAPNGVEIAMGLHTVLQYSSPPSTPPSNQYDTPSSWLVADVTGL